jgi:hypothetical protein
VHEVSVYRAFAFENIRHHCHSEGNEEPMHWPVRLAASNYPDLSLRQDDKRLLGTPVERAATMSAGSGRSL